MILIVSEGIEYISNLHFTASAQELNQNQNQTVRFAIGTLIHDGSPYQGNTSSPLTLIDFSDFQCYLCNRYVKNTEPILKNVHTDWKSCAGV